jgi:hypothetical protein
MNSDINTKSTQERRTFKFAQATAVDQSGSDDSKEDIDSDDSKEDTDDLYIPYKIADGCALL